MPNSLGANTYKRSMETERDLQRERAIDETLAAVLRFLNLVPHGEITIRKCDKTLLIEETKKEKKVL